MNVSDDLSCREMQDLLHGYLDGELDLVRSIAIERHLAGCAACAALLRRQQALRTVIRGHASSVAAPAGLAPRIRHALRRAVGPVPWYARKQPWVAAAALLVVATLAWSIRTLVPSRADSFLVQELVSDHARALLTGHLADVASSDRHTVKPWLSGKLGFSPPVVDLADQGFTLIGGRVDLLQDRPVAVLVYQRRQHLISVFLWPRGSVAAPGGGPLSRNGYQVVSGTAGEMDFAAVSELNADELGQLVSALRRSMPP